MINIQLHIHTLPPNDVTAVLLRTPLIDRRIMCLALANAFFLQGFGTSFHSLFIKALPSFSVNINWYFGPVIFRCAA